MRYGLLAAVCLFTLFVACEKSGDTPSIFGGPEVEYYKHVHEVVDRPSEWVDREIRIHGFVEAGSITANRAKRSTEFFVESEGKRLVVTTSVPMPENFRGEAEVVMKGKLTKAGSRYVFVAHELMAKCPSRYEGVGGERPASSY